MRGDTTNIMQQAYEKDFYDWINKNITLLKQRKFSELDIEILIDELESMAKRDKRELLSRLMVLIAHLLKWEFQAEQRSGSWRGSIWEQRIKIMQQLEDSPSLKNQIPESIIKAYPNALTLAVKETGLADNSFPQSCPYAVEQLLDNDFYPEAHYYKFR
ncbi:DUF29 domain-containing protein [Candidatus Venteria ishoeyi]|uniref:DUF29 domain-containing protein n=1 Tax=Candidatus Venteria ishoeyi TaxID=1899563 RepID=UPI0025A5C249|nr:DUF29 domain-containing protein [Candidatus Venteria ishoeyi]MDM8548120.1 DUF29 domain-containing protein [Candidatus Venteria ishoeyi]